jgi:hypothetical protein
MIAPPSRPSRAPETGRLVDGGAALLKTGVLGELVDRLLPALERAAAELATSGAPKFASFDELLGSDDMARELESLAGIHPELAGRFARATPMFGERLAALMELAASVAGSGRSLSPRLAELIKGKLRGVGWRARKWVMTLIGQLVKAGG